MLIHLGSLLNLQKLISDCQAGFKPRRNTIEHVIRLSQSIKQGFQHKQSTLAVFIDFRAAFDNVWRKMLLPKLLNLGIRGNLYRFIHSFLPQRFVRVRYKDAVSAFGQTKQGLPQGSVISPVLFNVMINDVLEAIETQPGLNALLYADDLVIWATSSNIQALESCLNDSLKVIERWCLENEMKVNPRKTEYQLFTLSTKQYALSLKYCNEHIVRTDEATYLGVKFDRKLTWGKHMLRSWWNEANNAYRFSRD